MPLGSSGGSSGYLIDRGLSWLDKQLFYWRNRHVVQATQAQKTCPSQIDALVADLSMELNEQQQQHEFYYQNKLVPRVQQIITALNGADPFLV
ncbi:MAG: hypothetical protein OXI96_03585 [Acidimicrobiaceae bacterium]|nr:hypothetical protein [Acidimicrobiaceae bacterium]